MRPTEISPDLELPEGYQTFDPQWFSDPESVNDYGVFLDSPKSMRKDLVRYLNEEMYLYTQHLIFYEEELLKQTRSSPNWEGGLVTYCTCKHNMRTYRDDWAGVWIGGLCPSHCADNCLLFVGKVREVFASNWSISSTIKEEYPEIYGLKRAQTNPRGDLYTPRPGMNGSVYLHENYFEPKNHTRSVEFYDKSPGSVSEREDGKIPKWWRDIEYTYNSRSPPCFILDPCWLFSQPLIWSSKEPGRAALKMKVRDFRKSLSKG